VTNQFNDYVIVNVTVQFQLC